MSPAVKVTCIKEAIRSKIQLDVNKQRLIFQGKLMRDEDNIADFKVGSQYSSILLFSYPYYLQFEATFEF